jgi:hypothetical protein
MTKVRKNALIMLLLFVIINISCIFETLIASNTNTSKEGINEDSKNTLAQLKTNILSPSEALENLKNAFKIDNEKELCQKIGNILIEEDYKKLETARSWISENPKVTEEIKASIKKSISDAKSHKPVSMLLTTPTIASLKEENAYIDSVLKQKENLSRGVTPAYYTSSAFTAYGQTQQSERTEETGDRVSMEAD